MVSLDAARTRSQPVLALATAREPSDSALVRLAGGLTTERWFRTLVTPQVEAWVERRWDDASLTWQWLEDDRLSWNKSMRHRAVDLGALSPRVRTQVLVGMATDEAEGNMGQPGAVRSIVRAAEEAGAGSLEEVDDTQLPQLSGPIIRRWWKRFSLADGDPELEWLRDDVRLAVIKPDAGSKVVLNLGQITQPWLRDFVTEVLKARKNSTVGAIKLWSKAGIFLSRFLETQGDRGRDPSRLTGATMTAFASSLYATPDITDGRATAILRNLSSLLHRGRELDLFDRYELSSGFLVKEEHVRTRPVKIESDKSIPRATMRLLLGTDDILGERSLQLAESVAFNDFSGRMFRSYVVLASQFGRRPEELAKLRADRLRPNDAGSSEMLYDNFKSGRSHVWLPVDAHSAALSKRWISELRDQYPDTPLKDLALFPSLTKNPRGTRASDASTLTSMFRRWVTLLEQAIVLAHLHRETHLPLQTLVLARARDVRSGSLHVDGVSYPLGTTLSRDMIDYAGDCQARMSRSTYCPEDLGDVLLFREPSLRPSDHPKSPNSAQPTNIARFDALGEGWLEAAAEYPCAGIPGPDFGARRISSSQLAPRLFRHTYLQDLVNIGVDIFLVQELADHSNVQTTIDSYVRINAERLREAMDLLAQHRVGWLGRVGEPAEPRVTLPSRAARDVGTNDCNNPKVLDLGSAGCDLDRMCFTCDHYIADPSNMPDMKSEIHTINLTLARLRAAEQTELSQHHEAVLLARRAGWESRLGELQRHLDELDEQERAKVVSAAQTVREFRSRNRNGGINVSGVDLR